MIKKIQLFFIVLLLISVVQLLTKNIVSAIESPEKYIAINMSNCNDTDGGKDFYTKGSVTDDQYPTSSDLCILKNSSRGDDYATHVVDECSGDLCYLSESLCVKNNNEDTPSSIKHYCTNGCNDGACIKKEGDKFPDLVITNVEFSASQKVLDRIDLFVTVKNNGDSASGRGKIRAYEDGGSWGTTLDTDGLEPDEERIFRADLFFRSENHTTKDMVRNRLFNITIENNGLDEKIEELNEDNNFYQASFVIDALNFPTTYPEAVSCVDSDDGYNYHEKGLVESKGGLNEYSDICEIRNDYKNSYGVYLYKETDNCIGENCYVKEYSCDTETEIVLVKNFFCQGGCKNGACLDKENDKYPDLIITNVEFKPENPMIGENIEILITIKNQGTTISEKSEVRLRAENGWSTNAYGYKIQPQEEKIITTSLSTSLKHNMHLFGKHTFSFNITNKEKIEELKVDNNFFEKVLNISAYRLKMKLNRPVSRLETETIEREKNLIKDIDQALVKKVKGKILLQVEGNGEAWYVDPVSENKLYLRNGQSAYDIMRILGLGVSNVNLEKIPIGLDDKLFENLQDSDNDGLPDNLEKAIGTNFDKQDSDNDGYSDKTESINGYKTNSQDKYVYDQELIDRLSGKILIQVESRGEAWYINPTDNKRYYLGDGDTAYNIMRYLSLGINNENLRKIQVGEFY